MTIKDALAKNKDGYYIGNRMVLPFKCQIIKIMFDKETHHQMVGNDEIQLHQDPMNTSIYFPKISDLNRWVNTHYPIKLIVAEMDADLTHQDMHVKLVGDIEEDHILKVHPPDENVIWIE